MSEYTHNDDVADLLYQAEAQRDTFRAKVIWLQTDILLLERRITELQAEVKRLETENAHGF
jgi:uncharacterized small protein (DUF1192 family)